MTPITSKYRSILLIGKWRVDPALDEISSEGKAVKLEPRAMRLLLCLAARPGDVVDIQELLDEVWPGVVVAQGSVYQAIAQLRGTLGDGAEQPTYIDTVSRKGYRLIASVTPWIHEALVPAQATPADKSIAVLPFANLSADKDNEYFSDGVVEEILNALSQVDDLRVASRNSSFRGPRSAWAAWASDTRERDDPRTLGDYCVSWRIGVCMRIAVSEWGIRERRPRPQLQYWCNGRTRNDVSHGMNQAKRIVVNCGDYGPKDDNNWRLSLTARTGGGPYTVVMPIEYCTKSPDLPLSPR